MLLYSGQQKLSLYIVPEDQYIKLCLFLLSIPGFEENEWQPPTEAEMKILQARRERQDKISKLMGGYLLKGYKMLGTNCNDCGVSLLFFK